MMHIGNAIWLAIVVAGVAWFLMAFTVVGFPLVVAVVIAAAVWMLVELVYAEHLWHVRNFRPIEARHRAS